MTIGERIAALRRAAGLSQEQMAEMLEVSRQAVSKWETGQTLPEADRIPRICALFSVSADELLGLEVRMPVIKEETLSLQDGNDLMRAGLCRRVFTMGCIAALTGAVLLAIGYLSTWSVYHRAIQRAWEYGLGYRSDVMYYAGTMPLAAVFWIGGLALIAGLALAAFGLYKGLNTGKNRAKAGK